MSSLARRSIMTASLAFVLAILPGCVVEQNEPAASSSDAVTTTYDCNAPPPGTSFVNATKASLQKFYDWSLACNTNIDEDDSGEPHWLKLPRAHLDMYLAHRDSD